MVTSRELQRRNRQRGVTLAILPLNLYATSEGAEILMFVTIPVTRMTVMQFGRA